MLCEDEKQAVAVKSQLQLIARPMYSNPPLHGALIVSTVLGDPDLKKLWLKEVKVKCHYFLESPPPSPWVFNVEVVILIITYNKRTKPMFSFVVACY